MGRGPSHVSSLVRLWRGVHAEGGRYLGSTRNGVTDLGVTLNLCVVTMRRYYIGKGDLVSTSPPLFLDARPARLK